MPNFDFITEVDFRKSLENDFEEMRKSIDGAAWKSAQVAAGSIVEALLVDYLVSVPSTTRSTTKDPLAMDLAEAIAVCRAEKVLSDRTADLCSVVRSYRNLIHPGRLVRLGEPLPNRDSATIALSLVAIITDEVARTRRKLVGLTAEQLLSKIERDQEVLSFFKHLVQEANEHQRERLLMELLPAAHSRYASGELEDWLVAQRIAAAYEITVNTVSDATKAKAAGEFVRVLREEDGAYVARFASAFFRASALQYVPNNQRPLLKGYLLSRLESEPSEQTLQMVDGLDEFLSPEEASKWVDPLVKLVASGNESQLRLRARNMITWAEFSATPEICKKILARLNTWKTHYQKAGANEKSARIDEVTASFSPP